MASEQKEKPSSSELEAQRQRIISTPKDCSEKNAPAEKERANVEEQTEIVDEWNLVVIFPSKLTVELARHGRLNYLGDSSEPDAKVRQHRVDDWPAVAAILGNHLHTGRVHADHRELDDLVRVAVVRDVARGLEINNKQILVRLLLRVFGPRPRAPVRGRGVSHYHLAS
jgi:hypothetical protein